MNKIKSEIEHCAQRILALQQADGRIFWVDDGVFDPWNHTLSAMALAVAGYREQAEQAYAFLHQIQQSDGSLPGQCGASAPMDKANRKLQADKAISLTDTNFSAFPIFGILHSYTLHGDKKWLQSQLPFMDRLRDFVLSHQSPHGDICWRRKQPNEQLEEVDALRTGNCSIFKSLQAADQIDQIFARTTPKNIASTQAIQTALLEKPFRFDRTWPSKDRFAMDWYYPVLCGVVEGEASKNHIDHRFDEFVDAGLGCRCVSDQPWTTTAETCELVLALLAIGRKEQAAQIMDWLLPLRADDGGYWMGWQSAENIYWPQERPSWTAAAMILALDALHKISPAHQLLIGRLPTLR